MAHAPGQEEERARRKVAALSVSGPVPDEAVRDWADARRQHATWLRALPIEEAHRFLGAELQKLEAQLERLEEGVRAGGEAALRDAVELGQRLRWVLWLGDVLSSDRTVDPLVLLDQELDRAELRSRELARFDLELAPRIAAIERQISLHREALLELRLARFSLREPPDAGISPLEHASRSWLAVAESFQIEARLLEARGKGREAGSGARPLEHERRLEALQLERAERLAESSARLESLLPEEAAEFAHAAVADLLDEAGGHLSGTGRLPLAVRLEVLELLHARIDSFLAVLGSWRSRLARKGELDADARRRFRADLRGLLRLRRRIAAAEEETATRQRLERAFGARPVRWFERLVLAVILAFVAVVVVELYVPPGEVEALHYAELAFCAILQLDFIVRCGFSGWSGSYFLRHFFLESLPALPYGWMLREEAVQLISFPLLARAVRLLRAPLLLAMRAFRLVVFLVRGIDRTVEAYRGVLDRDVVLFDPNPLGDSPESPIRRRALTLEGRRQRFIRHAYAEMRWDERAAFLPAHLAALGAEIQTTGTLDLPYRRALTSARGEVHLERIIHMLLDCDVARALTFVGREGAERLSRILRLFDVPGLRCLPLLRRIVPAVRFLSPAEAASAAANAVGEVLQDVLGALRFWGDLSGITTGPQILDRIATAIITATKRPAIRLIVFGSLFLVVSALFNAVGGKDSMIGEFTDKLEKALGVPIVVLGLVCLIFLLAGTWMKRLAGEALEQYMRTADAQYYPLLKTRKLLALEDDMDALYRSVLKPESHLRLEDAVSDDEGIAFLRDAFLSDPVVRPRSGRTRGSPVEVLSEERDAILLFYRDFLDGPVLHRSDDKASDQLLGDPTIQEIRARILPLDARARRRLRQLDLDRGGILNLGPYFWFRFITESLAIETAKLVMEYNMACIPLQRRHLASEEARRHFEAFLAERCGGASDPTRPRVESKQLRAGAPLATGSFTAFDFLGPSAESDDAVRRRYGEEVLRCLESDRRAVVRDIFGTRPYHLLPRSERVFNPYRLYRKYLGGAKVLFLPAVLAYGGFRLLKQGVSQVRELVREVLGQKKVLRSHLSRIAGFDVAVRKINRMRKPFFMEALFLRASLDVEYLGLRLPGRGRTGDAPACSEDLDFIGALEAERRPIQEIRNRAVRDLRRLRLLLHEQGWMGPGLDELLDSVDPAGGLKARRGEVIRALVMAFITDEGSLRSLVGARSAVREFVENALAVSRRGFGSRLRAAVVLRLAGLSERGRRRRRLFDAYLRRGRDLEHLLPQDVEIARRAFLRAPEEVERAWALALEVAAGEDDSEGDAVRRAILRVAREHALWTRRLLTVRTVQALTRLDIRRYRELVWEVGRYAED